MKAILRVAAKTLLIQLIILAVWQLTQPLDSLGKLSLYNRLFPGRERLPFGETPRTAYNFSLTNLNAMFASHKISAAPEKSSDTLRVVIIGDSSAWGTLLRPEETLAGQLDGQLIPGTQIHTECYNLAYPTLSLSKDILLLQRALEAEPDLIIWSLTLESFPMDKQQSSALTLANAEEFNALAETAGLKTRIPLAHSLMRDSLWGQRRELADLIRLQLYGVLWAGTGIDQDYTLQSGAPQLDLEADNRFHGVEGIYPDEKLAWDVLEAAVSLAKDTPILILNEPILISHGKNSKIRYNFYYPRQAYDAWRQELTERSKTADWQLLDLWDFLPPESFTNSAIHYNAESAGKISSVILDKISEGLIQ